MADDPEGPAVFDAGVAAWRRLPHAVRNRVHLASLPTTDAEENTAIVNALQRHASGYASASWGFDTCSSTHV